mmetsp:Transcript_18139/g.40022  ORF Transcript_18139/g.40022 Transcript_18139/m.40022 type:complete len:100 (-) Transcript_18139:9-308(-)
MHCVESIDELEHRSPHRCWCFGPVDCSLRLFCMLFVASGQQTQPVPCSAPGKDGRHGGVVTVQPQFIGPLVRGVAACHQRSGTAVVSRPIVCTLRARVP